MKILNSLELKKVIEKVKTVQGEIKGILNDEILIDEARKYAQRQGKEVKAFLERERKELEKFHKFLGSQKDEIGKLLENVRQAKAQAAGGAKTSAPKQKTKRKAKSKG